MLKFVLLILLLRTHFVELIVINIQFSLSPEQQYQVQEGDRVGFTCEEQNCPVSYDLTSDMTLWYMSGSPSSFTFPTLYSTYIFNQLIFSSTWSAAVEISGNRKNYCSSK